MIRVPRMDNECTSWFCDITSALVEPSNAEEPESLEYNTGNAFMKTSNMLLVQDHRYKTHLSFETSKIVQVATLKAHFSQCASAIIYKQSCTLHVNDDDSSLNHVA